MGASPPLTTGAPHRPNPLMPTLEALTGKTIKLIAPSAEQWQDHLAYLDDDVAMAHLAFLGPGLGKWTRDNVTHALAARPLQPARGHPAPL